MRIVDAVKLSSQQIKAALAKPPFDEVELSEGMKAGIRSVFGEELSAAQVVERIVADVRRDGDKAVLNYTRKIDRVELTPQSQEVSAAEIEQAIGQIDKDVYQAIKQAVANVREFHTEQKPKSWLTYREQGTILGQSAIPLDSVGIYVPGGTATYPSSVIMNAVPAAVAGVENIVMVVPPARDGSVNPYVLAAAKECGVTRIFKIGGAQAVAALAFGTETVPKVDKITGPGNIFVTLAKKAVYGYCDIDMLAGPSEILIVADETANPEYVAADLLSQAEHDVLASSILITDSQSLADAVQDSLARQLAGLERKNIAGESLQRNGLIVLAENMMKAVEYANLSAPEHLEIMAREPFQYLPYVRHAGAVFLGEYSPEPLGDYYAGPNHVLPTGGTARFYSVLNVETFMKKTSIIAYSQPALQAASENIIRLAQTEGLTAHANAIRVRRK